MYLLNAGLRRPKLRSVVIALHGMGAKRASRDGMHFGGGFQETADADDGQIMNHEEQMLAYCVHSLDKVDNEMR